MTVLVACEYSGTVRDAFLSRGHDAISCDLLPTERPGPHIQGDVLEILHSRRWSLVIGHPPCRYLARVGAHYLKSRPCRFARLIEAARFFRQIMAAPADHVVCENPIPSRHAVALIGKPSFYIQPWEFGHIESKKTLFWSRGVPPLMPTAIIDPSMRDNSWYYRFSSKTAAHRRAKTFDGVALAMADQWGGLLP